jgi:hypothetical protein
MLHTEGISRLAQRGSLVAKRSALIQAMIYDNHI